MVKISRRKMLALCATATAGVVSTAGARSGVRAAPNADLIFETDFAADGGYSVQHLGLWNGGSSNPVDPPTGWDGVIATGQSVVSVVDGEGEGGSNALRLQWDPNLSQPTISLGKHLTGDQSTGFDELYIRYHVRLPNTFRAGDEGVGLPYWKWGRLWQNTSTTPEGGWTENRTNSHYVVWNFGGNIPYTDANIVWGENTGTNLHLGSAGGERQGIDYFVSGSDQHVAPGYFESLWDINTTDRAGQLENNTSQGWHTIEYRFRLATSPTADDAQFEMWWNGVSQGPYARIGPGGGAASRSGIPTARMGSGFNFFSFFDNLNGWNRDWSEPGVDGSIYVNDVVVSRARIGHSYRVGDDSSQPPPRPDVVPIDKLVPALRLDHPATKSARFGSSNAFKA